MQYIKLARSGLDVSPICIGCMGFGEPPRGYPSWSLDEQSSLALIRHAIKAGINFFDTANMYSNGASEEIVGRSLKEFINRDAVVIATKLSAATRNGPNAVGLSRKVIMNEVDHSLRRLGTDYIDLYQIHRRDQLTPWEETLEALHDLVKMGKVRYLGASSMKAWEFSKALHLQKANGWTNFISMQDNYNLLAREEEREMMPLCADQGVQTMVYSPLARGRLARPWGESTARSQDEAPYASRYAATAGKRSEDRRGGRRDCGGTWRQPRGDRAGVVAAQPCCRRADRGCAQDQAHRRCGGCALDHVDGRRGGQTGGAVHAPLRRPGDFRSGGAAPRHGSGDRLQGVDPRLEATSGIGDREAAFPSDLSLSE